MNLATPYLGLQLKNPLVVGASPFCDNLDAAMRLQDAGAAALVMRSIFEEQIQHRQNAASYMLDASGDTFDGAKANFPGYSEYQITPDLYLEQIRDLKSTLTIPVIASLNGHRPGEWTDYAKNIAQAGADAIELNLYRLVTDPHISATEVEDDMIETVRAVAEGVNIPVSVKLSIFHTAPLQLALALERAGSKGTVVFNRFYQPDFNIADLEVHPRLQLSDPGELLLRLRWLAAMSPHVKGSLGCSGGAHSAEDIVKALLAGAHTVQLVSVLLQEGPRVISLLLAGLRRWMEEHEFVDLNTLRGALNLKRCPNPEAHERANYIRVIQSWNQ